MINMQYSEHDGKTNANVKNDSADSNDYTDDSTDS